MNIISRAEAKEKGLKQYFTGNPCPKGHTDNRNTSSGQCCTCARENAKQYHHLNIEERIKKHREWRTHNRDIISKNSSDWAHKNKAKKCEISSRYSASKKQAVPRWFDKDAVLKFYEEAARLTEETGITHNVDHIVPLQGEFVCGLHVQNNLQVITQTENCSKGNKLLL